MPPSSAHWLGTDQFGRDVLARVLHGLRVSLGVAASAVLLAGLAGGLLGLVSGYVMGPLDLLVQGAVDLLMSFPPLLLAVAVAAALGTGTRSIIIALSVVYLPRIVRVTRGIALTVVAPRAADTRAGFEADLAERYEDGSFRRSIIKVTSPDKYGIRVSDYFV